MRGVDGRVLVLVALSVAGRVVGFGADVVDALLLAGGSLADVDGGGDRGVVFVVIVVGGIGVCGGVGGSRGGGNVSKIPARGEVQEVVVLPTDVE